MARDNFQQAISELQTKILVMGGLVETLINKVIVCLEKQDLKLVEEIASGETEVDRLDSEITEKAIKLIALQQPMASDLRGIVTSIRISSDLERMADQALNIAEVVMHIGDEPLMKPLELIPLMAAKTRQMVKNSLDAFVNKNTSLAKLVIDRDDKIDNLFVELWDELIDIIESEPHKANQAVNLIFAGRYLERIADHATNISEETIYLVKGILVAHKDPASF